MTQSNFGGLCSEKYQGDYVVYSNVAPACRANQLEVRVASQILSALTIMQPGQLGRGGIEP